MTISIPPELRSIVRVYINSENEKDRERARQLCQQYGLDYATMRRRILERMITESQALGKSWTPAAGSRPLSEEAGETLYQLTEGNATYGVVVRDGIVIESAPYGRKRWMGRAEADVLAVAAPPHAAAANPKEGG